ncbi:MAG TPA: ABC transporter ATP-binding protein [Porphyromonadaceae bacterium]|nr:ABC transporter ATP-binding protein [Porphyromonadaceae bacterium]
MENAVKHIHIENLLGKYTLDWSPNPDVNILVGINGSGKSTLLRKIDAYFNNKIEDGEIQIDPNIKEKLRCLLINTFDVSVRDKKQLRTKESPLDLILRELLFATGKKSIERSFVNYRLRATDSSENKLINNKIDALKELINQLFSKTNKRIWIKSNEIVFETSDQEVIQLEQLSSGEKQLLIILFTVFLTEEQPFFLLVDEPEISLHIEWQEKLIDVIRELNPNCQLIIATHSPSIFGDGWGDKIFFMEDLMV